MIALHDLRRTGSSALVFGALLVAGIAGCSQKQESPQTQVSVEAVPVRIASLTEHVVTDAILTPIAQAAISPKITAPVKKFYVQRGSKVRAGQLMATLENRDLAAAVTDNRGSFDAAQATYQTAVQAQVPEDFQKAQLDVDQTKATLELNQKIVASRQQLFDQGAIPGRDLDTAKAALVQAQVAYDTAAKHLASMTRVSREAALRAAKGQLESAEGRYQGAAASLSYSEIRSPISGVVTDRPLFAGETAAAGTPLITVMDTSALLARVHVSQPQAQILSVGDAASVSVPGIDALVPGKITLISPALDPGSTTVEIWVRIENPRGQLRPGTAVHVNLAGRTIPKAVAVPNESIVIASSGRKTVMVVGSDGAAHQTEVATGISDGVNTQILSGVTPGQQVITKGAYALDDGTKVKVVASLDEEQSNPSKPGDSQ
jgi:HlyD family secretion protein